MSKRSEKELKYLAIFAVERAVDALLLGQAVLLVSRPRDSLHESRGRKDTSHSNECHVYPGKDESYFRDMTLGNTAPQCVRALETLDQETYDILAYGGEAALLLPSIRLRAAGMPHEEHPVIRLALTPDVKLTDLRSLAGLAQAEEASGSVLSALAGQAAGTQEKNALPAIALAKLAKLIPAVIVSPGDGADGQIADCETILNYDALTADLLAPVCTAPLTLRDAPRAEMTLFRAGRHEHYAISVGDRSGVPLVRVHSSCFTGDILASLRCDCGDQLHAALRMMAEHGGGVLLYLMQEGRGIGLANKLRSYRLQAEGSDTVDANALLGFDDDERPYLIAASMLKQLGVGRVRLLTNNPRKAVGLEELGIEVTERVPLIVQAHGHNHAYLETKFSRLGHLQGGA